MSQAGSTNNTLLVAQNFYHHLLNGNFSAILDAFEGEPMIDAPRTGAVVGREAVQDFLDGEKSWLVQLGGKADAVRTVKNTISNERIVHEVGIHMPIPPAPRPIMFAAVVDIKAGGIGAIRLYYSYGFLTQSQKFVRKAMLPADDSLLDAIPAPALAWVDAIAEADFNVRKIVTNDAYVMGVPSVPFKGSKLVWFLAIAMVGKGGVPLKMVSVTSDHMTSAIEENLDSWGTIQFEDNTAGLAVYDFNEEGLVTAARIYDDIPVNPFSKPGYVYENWEKIASLIESAGVDIPFVPTAESTPLEIKKKLLF